MPTEYAIYVNLKGREPQGVVPPGEAYISLCERIKRELLELKDTQSGGKVVKRAFLREEIYQGPYTEAAPDILFQLEPGYLATPTPTPGDYIQDVSSEGRGCHAMDGILVVAGPHIRKGEEIAEARIIDLAPTILHIMGLPVPKDMDGHVLTELFTLSFQKRHAVTFDGEEGIEEGKPEEKVYSPNEEAEIEERLRGLGYLG
jgi:predicted AlkP superfamily phosphohydrolase/phosphomutase